MTVELVSNGTDAIKYKLTIDDRCKITQINGDLVKNEETGLYEITNPTGKFVIQYEYKIFDEYIPAKYTTDSLQKLVYPKTDRSLYVYWLALESKFMSLFNNNIDSQFGCLRLDGYGLTWRTFKDIKDPDIRYKFNDIINFQYCTFNTEDDDPYKTYFEISINGTEFVPAYYLSYNDTEDISRCVMLFKSPFPIEKMSDAKNVKLRLNGQIIFDSDTYNGGPTNFGR